MLGRCSAASVTGWSQAWLPVCHHVLHLLDLVAAHAAAASPMWRLQASRHPRDPALCAAASTGLAASALGGTTLNAFAGVGRAEGSVEQLARLASRPSALQRWRRAKTLIVDEVSPSSHGRQQIESCPVLSRWAAGPGQQVPGSSWSGIVCNVLLRAEGLCTQRAVSCLGPSLECCWGKKVPANTRSV